MYPVTDAVKALYAAEQRQVLRITGTDKNGVAINITDANVVLGSFNIDRYSCNGNRLEVGTAIAAEMTVKLDNHAGTYNGIVFEGTELFVEIGIGDPVQWMPCGYFTPDEQPRTANQITIHALDRMVKFDNSVLGLLPWTTETGEIVTNEADQPIYFMPDLAYPATIQSIIQTVCGYYYVPFTQDISSFPNYNYTISEAPNLQQPTTYRNIIQWCAGIMGTCAWIDWTGSLRFSWYGATTGYVSTPANRFSSDLHEDDVEITGVQYTNLQNYTVLAGRPEYTIDMTGNYLMAGNVTQILTTVNNAINGFTYRPFSATIINAPYLWPMDEITFTDKDGNDHVCVLTNVNFGINGAMSVEGKGESMQAASRDALSGMTKEQGVLVEQAREATQQLDNNLTQEEIFNRLTENGAAQGLYLVNGQLYVNASYIQAGNVSASRISGGTLTLGGTNDVNGVIRVLDASGNVLDEITSEGLSSVSADQQTRALVRAGEFALQTWGISLGREIWRDQLSISANDASTSIVAKRGILFLGGYGGVTIDNQAGYTDQNYATVSMQDDSLVITLKGVGTNNRLRVEISRSGGISVSQFESGTTLEHTLTYTLDDGLDITFPTGAIDPDTGQQEIFTLHFGADFRVTANTRITGNVNVAGDVTADTLCARNGVTTHFYAADGKTVTVTNGIITNIA